MTPYYQNLNFNIQLLKDGCSLSDLFNKVNSKKVYHSLINIKEYINPELLDFLAELEIFPDHCEMFYSTPNFVSKIHVDARHGNFTKINWVFGGKDSVMNWYKPKDNIIRNEPTISAIKSMYIGYHRSEVDLLYSAPLGLPAIVQVGVPHNILNPIQDRCCISLGVSSIDKNNQKYNLTMQESVSRMSRYISTI